MTTVREFTCDDFYKFSYTTLDPLTEVYGMAYYMDYMARWPQLFRVAESPGGIIVGYMMGKVEGRFDHWHGHVTALTISPEYRRFGLATKFMQFLENLTEEKHCFYIDLFVRKSNLAAIKLYQKLGFIIYRIVLKYYTDNTQEDAFDMRKPLSRDVEKRSLMAPASAQPIKLSDLEYN